jgi:hypothetical protein
MVMSPSCDVDASAWTLSFALGGLLSGLLRAIAVWRWDMLSGVISPAALLLISTPVVCMIPLRAFVIRAVPSLWPSSS